MGIILSRVRKKSTLETLEKLDNDIKEIEENGVNARRNYEKITRFFLIFCVALYILCGIVFYFHFTTLQEKLLYLVPLAISPLLLYIVKRIISWYFVRLLNKNQKRLSEMRKEKKKILDEVMDKETYKVAKEILEKFDTETVPKPSYGVQQLRVHKKDDGLRKRVITASSSAPRTLPNNEVWMGSQTPLPSMSSTIPSRPHPAPATPMLPAPILPLHRSYMDKIVEYLIGDGPNNRYALICSQCHSHNGMALKEEFEYIGFKCCYCFFFNPARKVRPEAPKLEFAKLKRESDSDADAEKTSDENSEEEQKPVLDEKQFKADEEEISNSINEEDKKAAESNPKELNDEAHQDASTPNAHTNNSEEVEVQKFSGEHISSNIPRGDDDANCDELSIKS